MSTKVSYIGCGYNMIAFYSTWTIVKVQPVQMQGKFTKNYLFYDKVTSLRNLTADRNPFVQIAKPTQNLPHLLSMWSNMRAPQILSQILSLQKNM